MSETTTETSTGAGAFGFFAAAAGPGGAGGMEIIDAEIVEDDPPAGGAGQPPAGGRIHIPPPPSSPPPAPQAPEPDWAQYAAAAAAAAAAHYQAPPPYVPIPPQYSYPDPGSVVPVEVVAPQPVPVMVVAPPAEPGPFWDFSWLQPAANATAMVLAAVPAWLLHRHLPIITGSYGADAAAAIAILWGGKPALRSLALASAAYYGCAAFHTTTATTAAVELVAIALPLAGTRRHSPISMLRRTAVWIPILSGCLSLPAVIDAVTWLTTAFTGGH
ncbi:hypothetical protein [Streptomyces sp. CBMA156]|uniref:hypothetical protein n=1 Tax=Streptomyces sp. CBMA156 TaxID=1930280 RepID=UPI001661E782|nr:hypothetical protein [Streptomyces sp. CBMA156]MBD0673477.1 hypothetical protein [Streptomyces sp. CBMA156]